MNPDRLASSSRRPAQHGRVWLVLLLVLAVLGAGAWYAWPTARLHYDQLRAERALLRELPADLATLQQQLQSLQQAQLKLQEQVTVEGRRLGELAQTVDSGRAGLQLAAIEQLLLVANDQLKLANDVRMARRALEEADRRLARLDDPALLPVRETLAQERAALAALPDADRAGTALQLGELIRQAPNWPLRARSPERFSGAPAADVPADSGEQPWTRRLWHSVTEAIAGMFTVRRSQGAAPRLLPPGEEALVAQAMRLKLEGARLAVLAGDTATVRELCTDARAWLREYYNEGDAAVAGARRQLGELAQAAAPAPRPDITPSLARLRQFMDQRLAR